MRSMPWREPRSTLAAAVAACAVAAGCAGNTPPAESPSASPKVVAAAAAAPQAPPAQAATTPAPAAPGPATLPGAQLYTQSIPAPPPLAEAPGPLPRTFTLVTLPGVKRSLVAVEGRGPNDLWFLTLEEMTDQFARTVGGEILQFDGKRVKSHGHPCSYSMFGSIVVSRDAVVALGYRPWSRGVAPRFRAALVKDGTWDCEEDDGGYNTGLTSSSGDHVWELSCSYRAECRLEASGGPSIAIPTDHPSFGGRGESADNPVHALFLRGHDDGWMVREGEGRRPLLFRYNGVAWTPVAALEEGMIAQDIWAEGEDVWIALGRVKNPDAPAGELLRWNGRALSLVPVPKGFAAWKVSGQHGKDLWFWGAGRTLYQWDGAALRQGDAPFEVRDLWAGPGGEMWLVGPPTEAGGPPPGTVARALPLPAAGKGTP